ncbi:ABC transporter substrate-binding protein [Amycolatopsis sp. 195334CR]|uniref:ABC transporter substrate-binding protein n=1 Tax=Amycolatopsis sp. 195334CR TaxID=2814588 RepID=UPI001A8D2AC5|nr:extracellular solute-binding protein [Amycolatopsis sp. 195334CR]MBN6042228.1 extracellular solute-binding protein [Amycolatopsis sp. 195334CR]
MKRPARWAVALLATLALAGCGSASGPESSSTGTGKLVVWDWKSGDPAAAAYLEKAKADFAGKHPGVTVEFVAQPFDQYYTLLGTAIQAGAGPDVVLFNGGGRIRDRVDALVPLDPYVAEDRNRLTGWDAFGANGKTYASPVTLQGHPIYFNKKLYREAGLDPDSPPATWNDLTARCATIKDRTGARCFALGNKEGAGIQFFLSGLGSGALTDQEYRDWIAGKRDWSSPNVKRIFELWTETDAAGLNTEGANSTAMFNDSFAKFQSGEAAHVIGLMSDVGHWQDFGEFLDPADLGVLRAPVITAGTAPSLPYDGGIGYAVTRWTADPARAADLVRSLTTKDALAAFHTGAGAIAADTSLDVSEAGPVVSEIVSGIAGGRPALHVALSSSTLDLMGRLSQQLLSGSVTVDDALAQLAASDRDG